MNIRIEGEPWASFECEKSLKECTTKKSKRTVHYGDADYYDLLPPNLQYLRGLPFADGSLDFCPPSYEVEIDTKSQPETSNNHCSDSL